MNKSIIVPSPDKKRRVTLTSLGKTQSGHEYYALTIEGISVSLKIVSLEKSALVS